jgi:hypothetical protein
MDLALQLKNGTLKEPHDRVIGYPILLLLTASAEVPTRMLFWLSLFLHAITVSCLYVILRSIKAPFPLVALTCGILLLPPYVQTTAYVLTENAAEFTLAVTVTALYLWFVKQQLTFLALSGASCALAFFFRPTYALLGIALLPFVFWGLSIKGRHLRILRATVAVGIFTFPSVGSVLGYCAVNYAKFGYFGVTPKSGFMLFTRTLTFLERIPEDERIVREVLIAARDRSIVAGRSHSGTQFMWETGIRNLMQATGQSKVQLSNRMLKLNARLIAAGPLEYIRTVSSTAVTFLFPYITPVSFFGSRIFQLLWSLLHFSILLLSIYYSVLILLAEGKRIFPTLIGSKGSPVCVLDNRSHEERFAGALMLVVILYTLTISCLVEVGDPRYAAPLAPMMVFTAMLSLKPLFTRLPEDR